MNAKINMCAVYCLVYDTNASCTQCFKKQNWSHSTYAANDTCGASHVQPVHNTDTDVCKASVHHHDNHT